MTTWWSSLLRPRDRGSALRLIASSAVGLVLFLLWASCPAAAAGEELRVIAVNTASAPRVSMVVQPPAELPDNGATAESCSVTIDEESVACTVTPMASDSLSVALVIDTASDLTAQELAAVQSGAIDFLLGLPQEANSMVVAAGGEPQVVAPLRENAAEALSAISALRTGGTRATMAGTVLAAQSLESAPPGPRVIIVYAHGLDEQGVLVDQLSEAVSQANAVVNVIPGDAESIWPWVVDRTGGVVLPPTGAADIAQSYGRLATMLSEQYLVTFQVPDGLPAVAQVAFQSGDQEYRTVVNLPDADTEQAAPTEGRSIVGLVSLVAAGLVLIGLAVLALVLRARRRASEGGSPPAEAAAPTASTPATAPATPPLQSPSRRGSLSAAVHGRRSAQQTLDQASSAAQPGKAAAAATAGQPPAAESDNGSIVLTGSGNAVVELTKNAPGPAVVYIWGNAARRYFAIKTVRTEETLVNTMQPYDGVRSLDWEGGESTGFRVRATGPWRIEVLPLSAIPTFHTSLKGDGDMVVHFTGHGSCAEINGNDAGGYFIVRAFSRNGKTDNLVNTNKAYAGTSQISGEPQYFEVHADGPWTITVK